MQDQNIIQNFRSYIRQIAKISDKEFNETISKFELLTLQKGGFFIEQGKISRHIAFINKGILRTYYYDETGNDTTSCFCTKNSLTTSYRSFILQMPSSLTIQALETTELLIIDYAGLHHLYSKYAVWQQIGRLVAENEYLTMEKYASVLNNETAKEKYLRLIKEQPQIIQKAPVQYIASYLENR